MTFAGLRSWFSTLWLLRHPEIRRFLGDRRVEILNLDLIRRHNPSCKLADDIKIYSYATDRLEIGRGAAIESGTILALGDDENGFGQIRVGANTESLISFLSYWP